MLCLFQFRKETISTQIRNAILDYIMLCCKIINAIFLRVIGTFCKNPDMYFVVNVFYLNQISYEIRFCHLEKDFVAMVLNYINSIHFYSAEYLLFAKYYLNEKIENESK